MIALWIAFAPTKAGGMASYIIVIGNSMEPDFHIGDLVIAHEEAGYRVGDAVVYVNRELENFVFHRIIVEELGRFTLKGDNNSWVDTYQPTREEIIGRLWLRIPKGGKVIQAIRQPLAMALTAGALGGLLVLGFFSGRPKGRKQMNKSWTVSIRQNLQNLFHSVPADPHSSNQGTRLEGLFFAFGLIAFSSLIIGIISFSQPTIRSVQDDIGYDQLGFFAYAASAPQGVYDGNAVKSGDPIFPKLTCAVDMTFQYTLVAVQAGNISGTYQLTATISEPTSGWDRTVPLQEETTFSGNSFGANAKLDLCKMERLSQAMEQSTDFRPGSYLLTVSPNIKVAGEIAGRPLNSAFNPELVFRYDRMHFHLAREDALNGNILNASASGILSQERLESNTLRFLGRDFAVPALRTIAVLGLVVSLGGLAYLGWRLQALAQSNPVHFNQVRYGSQMIDLKNGILPDSRPVVDLMSMDDLGKLAERFNTMILHVASDGAHVYYVQGEAATYRFMISSTEVGSAVPAEEAENQP